MPKINKKLVSVVGAGLIVATGAGAAFAYWSTTGSGTGSATAGTDAGFAVTVSGPSNLVLDQAQNITVGITNKATFKQQLKAIHVTVTGTQDQSGNSLSASCLPSWFSVVDPTVSAHELAGSAAESYTAAITLVDNASDQNSCKGATVLLRADAS
ncbi:MAG: hypothetical protein ACTHMS_12955 [Jatrophihabitans sp.]|uniref:hypothetical protein n=1 Tax=Jatrophihabitans sp. TaxID=1932789 RepID=UPI003F80A3BC